MADIAFLLLIFFLVTTTIDIDKGILTKLPPYSIDNEPINLPDRNVFSVKINAQNELLIEGNRAKLEDLKSSTKNFILNPTGDKNLSISPKSAVISLQNDRGTTYETYLHVYNELKAAYNELWDEKAMDMFGKTYTALNKTKQVQIRKEIPLVVSEAEPTDYLSSYNPPK